MPQVASDAAVSRPQRPEPPSGRAGAPAGESSGAFESLLDSTPAPTRPERATQTKSGDTPNTPQDTNGQSTDASELVAKTPEIVAEAGPIPVADFAALAAAVSVAAPADAEPVAQNTGTATVTPEQPKRSEDAVVLTADATAIPVAVGVIAVAVAPPPPLPATSPGAPANAEAGIAPVALQASAPATPAIPAAAANPEPSTLPSPAAENSQPAPAKPQIAADAATAGPVETTVSPDDAQKAVALKGAPETSDKKDPTAVRADGKTESDKADGKTESDKAKADHPGAVRAPRAHPHLKAAKPASDAAPEPQPNAVQHQPRPETAERAPLSAHAAAADPRPDLPATAAPQAQIHAGGPVPFGLGLHAASPLAALSPLTALRIDVSADNAVPVAGLAVEIVSRAQDGLRRFEIRLDPPELGRIDVRLDVDTAGKVTSRLTVERAETLDLLRRDAPQLERALQHAGLNTEGGLEFSLRDQNFANREQAQRNPAATQLVVPDDEAVAAEAARRGYGRIIGLGGGVDIRV